MVVARFLASVRRSKGLPHERQFQPAPTDSPQSTAELLSQAGSASAKMYLKRGKCCLGLEVRVKKV